MAATIGRDVVRVAVLACVMGAATTACGARSSLETSGPAGGSGGATGGATGGGGTGGAPCNGPVLISPVVTVDEDVNHENMEPEMAAISDDGEEVAVALRRSSTVGQSTFIEIRHGALRPWTDWPADGAVTTPYETYGAKDFAQPFFLAGSPGSELAMLIGDEITTSFSPHVDPGASGGTPTIGLPGPWPTFLTRNGASWLAGGMGAGGTGEVHLLQEKGGGFEVETQVLACSETGILAAAAPYQDGYLVASTNGVNNPPGTCADIASAGSAGRVDLSWIHAGAEPEALATFDWPSVPGRLVAVPHPDGAWILFSGSKNGNWRVWGVRLDATSKTLTDIVPISGTSSSFPQFAAAALGRSLVVAWGAQQSGSWSTKLVVLDESWKETASLSMPDMADSPGPQAMVSSDEHGSVVISYQAGKPARANLARVDCLGPQGM